MSAFIPGFDSDGVVTINRVLLKLDNRKGTTGFSVILNLGDPRRSA
jgi:hypothetical protein